MANITVTLDDSDKKNLSDFCEEQCAEDTNGNTPSLPDFDSILFYCDGFSSMIII